MYAIIKTGGKQFKVEKGTAIKVEKLDAEVGSEVAFEALMVTDGKTVQVGTPVLADVTVKGKVIAHDKAKKVIVFKYKPKTDYRKKQGHRQPYTKVEIIEITAAGMKDEAPASAVKAAAKPATKAAAKPAAKAAAKPVTEAKPAAKKAAADAKPAAAKKPAVKADKAE